MSEPEHAFQEAVDWTPGLARHANFIGWALAVVALLVFGLTFVAALAYLAVKDNFDTAGVLTTYGSAVFADHVPSGTAEAVRRAEAGGYAVVGKTNLHEFAYGATSQNPHYGTVPNPRARGRTAGGSSGGSAAAVAAGLADAALGSDTGGSVRIPAACCGIAAFKPSFRLVSTEGLFPLAPSFDHVGVLAATVQGCADLMKALDPDFRVEPLDLEEVRFGFTWADRCDPHVRARLFETAALLPRRLTIAFPEPEGTTPALWHEIAGVHRELFEENHELYGDNVRTKVERCLEVTDAEADEANEARKAYKKLAREALAGLDLLLAPTLGFVAPLAAIDELEWRDRLVRFTYPFNLLGWPALTLPGGRAEDGLPSSLQLIGRAGDDERVLAAGLALEAALSR
jgi:aspartyl-tRNA(Asn)/glutamyl-tRNA(Gln) amidotransferase subunit A